MAVDAFTASDRFRKKGMSDQTVGDGTILVLRQRIFVRLRRLAAVGFRATGTWSWRLVH
jgi:hypothetical protein